MNRHLLRLVLPACFAAWFVAAPALGQKVISKEETPSTPQYDETRERLTEILGRYPPRLGEVLELDPTLLSNKDYLAPYADLRTFLQEHPEIARDPEFFLAERSDLPFEAQLGLRGWKQNLNEEALRNMIENGGTLVYQEPPSQRMWRDLVGRTVAIAALFTAIGILAWIVRTVIDHRRWLRVSRIQAEAYSKLMDRFTTNAELLAYLQTPAGKRFLDVSSLPTDFGPPRSHVPVNRILWSVQIGLLLTIGGMALFWMNSSLPPELIQGMNVISVLAVALGISFMMGAGASYVISEKLGLLEVPRKPGNVEPPAPSA